MSDKSATAENAVPSGESDGRCVLLPRHLVESKLPEFVAAGFDPQPTEAAVDGLTFDAYVLRLALGTNEDFAACLNLLGTLIGRPERRRSGESQAVLETVMAAWQGRSAICLFRPCPESAKIEADPKEWEVGTERETFRLAMGANRLALSKFNGLTGLKPRLISRRGEQIGCDPVPEREGEISLFANNGPTGARHFIYRHILFGLNISGQPESASCAESMTGRGLILKDEDDVPAVQIIGRTVYLLCPVFSHYHGDESDRIFWKLLCLAQRGLRQIQGQASAAPAPPVPVNRRDFTAAVFKEVDDWPSKLEDKIQEKKEEIARLLAALALSQRSLAEYQAVQDGVGRMSRGIRSKIRRDYDRLAAHPDIESFAPVDDGLNFRTRPVVIDSGGRRYATGRFTIRLDFKNRLILVWNDRPLHPDGHSHPHLEKDNTPCFGNAGTAIYTAVAEWRIFDAVDLTVRWLKVGYTPELARQKVGDWPWAGDDGQPLPLDQQGPGFLHRAVRAVVREQINGQAVDLSAWRPLFNSGSLQTVLDSLEPADRRAVECLIRPEATADPDRSPKGEVADE